MSSNNNLEGNLQYEIMETASPANAEQLHEKELEGLRLQLILPWDGKLYYHFVQK